MGSDDPPGESGQKCPHCGESWDSLMHQPALREIGHNPKSGTLYSCGCCLARVTDDEIETGKTTSQLVDEGHYAE